jgi:iron complex outermembrane recepter protein
MAGRRGSSGTVSTGWRVFLALCLLLCIVATSAAEARKVYDIDLRAQSVADALNGLSEQTGVPVVFPYALAKDRTANPVVGRYTLLEALDALLKDTGLSGGLSERGVLTIFPSSSPKPGETIVKRDDDHNNTNDKKHGRPMGIAAFFASMAAAFSASAQEAADTANGDQTKLESVVITAEKREERLQDVPVPVSVIKADDLVLNNQSRIRDYYQTVPGLTAQADILAGQYMAIRGITTGGGNPTVAMTIDDAPFSSSTNPTQSGFEPDIDPGDLERVEVLRGPQGTLYGANSMGGLIRFVTKDPSTDAFSGRIETGTSNVYNGAEPGYNVRGSVNIPITDTFAIRANAFTRQDPGYIDNPVLHIKGINESQAEGGRVSALWRISDDVSLKLAALSQENRTNGASDVDIAPGLGPLQQNYIPGMGGDTKSIRDFSAVLNAKMGDVQLTSVTGYWREKTHETLDFSYVFGSAMQQLYGVSGAAYNAVAPSSKLSQELRLSGSIWRDLDWLVGAFYTHEHAVPVQTIGGENPVTGQIVGPDYFNYINPDDTYTEYAGFASLTYHFTDRFDVQVGGRGSHLESDYTQLEGGPFYGQTGSTLIPVPDQRTTNNVFTYLVTPQLTLSHHFMVYGRLASGFRPGAANAGVPGIPNESNPDKTQNYELGLKAEFFERRLSLDTSVYYINWQDIQVGLNSPDGIGYNANAAGAKSEGVEFSVESAPAEGLTVAAWIAYDNAVLTKALPISSGATGNVGDRLPISPRISGHVSLNEDFPVWQSVTGFLRAEASYVGYREGIFTDGPRTPFPAYTKTDVRAGFRTDSWTFNLYANNVADVRGLIGGGVAYDPPNAFVYITPRTIGVNVVKTF